MESPGINYDEILGTGPTGDLDRMREFLVDELPYVWLDHYLAMLPHQHNVHRITLEGFEYLWDLSSELVRHGNLHASDAVDDRLVAAHGVSQLNTLSRDDARLRRRTLGPIDEVDPKQRLPYDRGHAIGHKLGGGLDINIIPQSRAMNRGGAWRQMERYCQEHSGTYFFCRPIYNGLSSHPAEIEFGILKDANSLWVNVFNNYGDIKELQEFERLYREKISGPTNLSPGYI